MEAKALFDGGIVLAKVLLAVYQRFTAQAKTEAELLSALRKAREATPDVPEEDRRVAEQRVTASWREALGV